MRLPDPLRTRGPYPPLLSVAMLAASALLTIFVLTPQLYVLAVATLRASFVWVTWYGGVFDWAVEFLIYAPWIPAPFILVMVFLLLRRLLVELVRRWRPPHRSGPRPLWVRALQVTIGIPLLASGLALAVLLTVPALSHGAGYYLTGGGSLQRDRCSRCHSPYRPFHFIKTPALWKTTVNRMRRLEGAPIDDEDQARITRYLVATAALKDDWIFRAKCLSCHSRGEITHEPRTAEEWRLIIGRVAKISPYAYRADWRGQLERFATGELSAPAPAAGTPGASALADKLIFERVCGRCHDLTTALSADLGSREAVVDRMIRKVPSLVRGQDRAAILRFMGRAPAGREHQEDLFPHDRMVWPQW